MLQISIDGKEVSVEQGATVIEAAQKLGTYIPHFCYHKKLSIAAS
ncbi:2Fe-2S iron-sulfur cluster-binding protein, partial [Neisseria elongata]